VRPFNDEELSLRFVERCGGAVRYAPGLGWLVYANTHWQRSDEGAMRLLRDMIADIPRVELEGVEDEETKVEVIKQTVKAQTTWRYESVLRLSRSDARICVEATSFDDNPWILNTPNGPVNLKTGHRETARRPEELLCSLCTNGKFHDGVPVEAPTWIRFLKTVTGNNDDYILTLQMALGSSIVGNNPERLMFILYGTGANGKSVLLDTIRHVLGSYSLLANATTFSTTQKTGYGGYTDTADFRGRRFITASEPETGSTLSEPLIKSMTGDSEIKARYLYQAQWLTFKPTFKVWLGTNHKPRVRGTEKAIWSRLRLLPFCITIPDERQDFRLPEKLRAEADGILHWLIEGCGYWQAYNERVKFSENVTASTQEYRLEEDTIGQFLEECCSDMRYRIPLEQEEYTVRSGQLYEAYRSWAGENGHKALASNSFSSRILARDFRKKSLDGRRYWIGLQLKTAFSQIPTQNY